jgi:hypothetical protein
MAARVDRRVTRRRLTAVATSLSGACRRHIISTGFGLLINTLELSALLVVRSQLVLVFEYGGLRIRFLIEGLVVGVADVEVMVGLAHCVHGSTISATGQW